MNLRGSLAIWWRRLQVIFAISAAALASDLLGAPKVSICYSKSYYAHWRGICHLSCSILESSEASAIVSFDISSTRFVR